LYVSERALYVIIIMRLYVSVGALYDIKMRASVCLKALYIILLN